MKRAFAILVLVAAFGPTGHADGKARVPRWNPDYLMTNTSPMRPGEVGLPPTNYRPLPEWSPTPFSDDKKTYLFFPSPLNHYGAPKISRIDPNGPHEVPYSVVRRSVIVLAGVAKHWRIEMSKDSVVDMTAKE